jgi:hypothetical protein
MVDIYCGSHTKHIITACGKIQFNSVQFNSCLLTCCVPQIRNALAPHIVLQLKAFPLSLHSFVSRILFLGYVTKISFFFFFYKGGPHWRSWLRHCSTSRKVAGSIPDGVIGIFLSFRSYYGPGVDSSSNRNE